MIIAIDGPAGAGKGTLAKSLASFLNYAYLDTGLLYRAVGLKMLEGGLDLADPQAAEQAAIRLKAEDLGDESKLRDEAVSSAASKIATHAQLRSALLRFQREFANHPPQEHKGAVLDGRDIGTVVCPNAEAKIFITASLEKRAKRRLKELQNRGIDSIYEAVLEDMRLRDERDVQRESSPLQPSEDALLIDTSELTIDDVFKKALRYVKDKGIRYGGGVSAS